MASSLNFLFLFYLTLREVAYIGILYKLEIKIVAQILRIQNPKTQMYYICYFVAFSFYFEIIDNTDNILTHLLLICLIQLVYSQKHSNFRPSKFE